MRDVTLVILNSLRIKCHIRRPLTNLRFFKVNLGNSSTFKALNSENKIQAHSRFSRTRMNPALVTGHGLQHYGTSI